MSVFGKLYYYFHYCFQKVCASFVKSTNRTKYKTHLSIDQRCQNTLSPTVKALNRSQDQQGQGQDQGQGLKTVETRSY